MQVRKWHITKIYCNAKLRRYRVMADSDQAASHSIWLKQPTGERSAVPVFCVSGGRHGCPQKPSIGLSACDQRLAEHDIGMSLGPPCKLGHTLEACLFIQSRRLEVMARHPDSPNPAASRLSDESAQ